MAEITKDGATGTTLSEYKEEIESAYLEIDSSWDIDPSTPDGLAIAVWAEMLANLDEEVLNAYHSVDPNSAIGQQLDRIAMFAGITRQAATHSTASVTFSGENLIEVPAGTLVRHRITGTLWATDVAVITDTNGTATVNVTCQLEGAQTGNAGTLTNIASVVGGVTSVNNDSAASLGLDEETDYAFRVRRNDSVALPGNNQIDTIYSSLVNMDGVKQVRVYENPDSEPDENGVLGHSMAIFIDGADSDDIVTTIATNKNPGCGLNRYNNEIPNKNSIDTFTTVNQQPVNVTYFRPEYFSVYVRVNIVSSTLTDADGDDIKQAIVDYSLYGLTQTVGFAKQGFRIGETIAAGRIFTPVNKLVGSDDYVANISIGLSSDSINLTTIPTRFYELGVFDSENIEVSFATPE